MTIATRRAAFLAGMRAGAPFLLVIAPFGMLFGVVGSEAGLDLVAIMGFTALVIAGAAQPTALQRLSENAPTLLVVAIALGVNLRMAMYSAALTPYLGTAKLWQRAAVAYTLTDQCYAASALRFEADPHMPLAARLAYFAGVTVPVIPCWSPATLAGALLGDAVPSGLAIDFAAPITLVAPALRTLAHVAAALVSGVLALALAWLPYNLGLIAAALAAMAAGAEVERRRETPAR